MNSNKDHNGPLWTLAGSLCGLVFSILLIPFGEIDSWQNESNPYFLVIILGTAIVLFLFGLIKTSLFYDQMPAGRKAMFVLAFVVAILAIVVYKGYERVDTQRYPKNPRGVLCGERYKNANTQEGVDAYYACMNGVD